MWQNIKIAGRLLKINILNGLMYRGDFWAGTITEILYMIAQLLLINYIFLVADVKEVGGFSLYQFYFVGAVFEIIRAIAHIFIVPSAGRFWSLIHYGKLDMVVLKPKMPVFVLFNNSWITDTFSGFIFSVLVIYYVWSNMQLTWGQTGLIMLVSVFSLVILGTLEWIGSLVNFYSARFDAFNRLLRSSIDVAKYPRSIYPRIIQNFYLFLVPIFLIANPIYEIMQKSFGWDDIKIILAMTVLLIGITWFLWVDGLRRYSSGN